MRVSVDTGRVPAQAFPLIEREDGDSVRTTTILVVNADRLQPGRDASCSKGTLHHVIKVNVTWEVRARFTTSLRLA